MYLKQHPTPGMRQQPAMSNQTYQPSPQRTMMTSQAPNVSVNQLWSNSNPMFSMGAIRMNPSSTVKQQPNFGPGYGPRVETSSCSTSGANTLPQLTMRDLQFLEPDPQVLPVSQARLVSQPHLLQQQHHHRREEAVPEAQGQGNQGNQNQGLHTLWSNSGFNPLTPVQSTLSGAVVGDGGAALGLSCYPLLEGMEGDDFLCHLVGGGPQLGFLKQEPLATGGQESHPPHMQSPMESQGGTYTNLLPRPMSNGTNMDAMRHEGGSNSSIQPLKDLQNPFSNNGMARDGHFNSLADWVRATRQSDYKE